MNITYFIGNGFDLNMGMKTSYKHFYGYLQKIDNFNNPIAEEIKEKPEQWVDYEIELGHYTKNVLKNNVEGFYNNKDQIDRLLIQYLTEQQNTITDGIINNIAEKFIFSINDFGKLLNQIPQEEYYARTNAFPGGINYNFVTFNYTDILDRIIECTRKKNTNPKHLSSNTTYRDYLFSPVHIHGTLDEGMIIAVNDITQIDSEDLKTDRDFLNSMIKIRMNDRLGNKRIQMVEKLIDESQMIILFGTSMGLTDKIWWEKIINWLQINNNHILYICVFDNKLSEMKLLPGPLNRRVAQEQDKFLSIKKELSYEQKNVISSRVNILFNPMVFDFGLLK